MCLAIPGRVIEFVDPERHFAKVEVSGVRRKVNVDLLREDGLATVATVGQPGTATPQTLWETTFTLQYEPVPSVITRLEFRYDKSNKNTFQYGTRSANHQETLSVDVIYLF